MCCLVSSTDVKRSYIALWKPNKILVWQRIRYRLKENYWIWSCLKANETTQLIQMKYNQHFPKVCLNSVDVFQKLVRSVEEFWSWISSLTFTFLKLSQPNQFTSSCPGNEKTCFQCWLVCLKLGGKLLFHWMISCPKIKLSFAVSEKWENFNAHNEDWIFLKNPFHHDFRCSIFQPDDCKELLMLIYDPCLKKLRLLQANEC